MGWGRIRCQTCVISGLFLAALHSQAGAADMARKGIKAADAKAGLQLNCENGRTYPILAKAISDEGELVTGYLVIAPRKHAYFRLVPMTVGYRYAGQGFWFDGIRGEASLKGKGDQISCTVESSI